MLIPAFSLPSNPAKNIQLREATVADAMNFASSPTGREEALLTSFLNTVQHKELFVDAKLWTAQDRYFAVFWYWLHTHKDPEIPFRYTCGFCGKEHVMTFDMRELVESYTLITGAPERDLEFAGKKLVVKPLRGEAMEALELHYLALEAEAAQNGRESAEYLKREAELKISRFLGLIDLVPPGNEREFILAMPASDFEQLVNDVSNAISGMSHGLSALSVDDEGAYFMTPPHVCPEKGGETRLRVPFHTPDYVPSL